MYVDRIEYGEVHGFLARTQGQVYTYICTSKSIAALRTHGA